MIVIEKGIPLPPDHRRGAGKKREERIALETMEIGQSFHVDGERGWIKQMVQHVQRQLPRRFTVRQSETGYRVWRTA